MDKKMMYAFRGWIAFLAFVDLGTAARSYIEKRSFLSKTISDVQEYVDEEFTTSRVLGLYSVLKAIVLIHCTLFIHYKPIVSMGICSLILTIILYFTETIYFKAATLNFYVLFPCILNIVTLVGLVYLPTHLKIWEYQENEGHSKSGLIKRKRHFKTNN
ncbi:unnamed protein product [Phaedon cochleariae]|uniref:Uncharacterized protein n=1 Tax=Phaedon cochleariae TaxID=80249 RepID=A0A9P0DUG7_PHACE|nr:unnamed protein product [Phaedon cochleariae]